VWPAFSFYPKPVNEIIVNYFHKPDIFGLLLSQRNVFLAFF